MCACFSSSEFPPPDISREYVLLHRYDVVTVEETVGNVTMNVTRLVPVKIIQLRVLVQVSVNIVRYSNSSF